MPFKSIKNRIRKRLHAPPGLRRGLQLHRHQSSGTRRYRGHFWDQRRPDLLLLGALEWIMTFQILGME